MNIGVDSRVTSVSGSEGLERALLEHHGVHDAVVVPRRDAQGKSCVIAYVVPADVRAIETLPVDLQTRLPTQSLPDGYVFLSCLPLDENGGVAIAELERYELIDQDLIDRWKGALDMLGPAAIIPVERNPSVGSTHRLDLLPGAPASRGGVSATAGAQATRTPAGRTKETPAVVPAVAHGRPLIESIDDPKTLGQALRRAAERHGDNGIVYIRQDGAKETQSYAQLLSEAGEVFAGLAMLGLRPGDKVILQLSDNREFLTAFWGCMLGGIVPAPISIAPGYVPSNATVQKLVNAWQLLEQPLILASDALVAGLRSALDLSGADKARVQSIAGLRGAAPVAPHDDAHPDDLALILFTSGSTGIPKGVMQSHRSLLCMANGTIQHNAFTSRDVTLNWMPLEHVGAISFLHTMPVALGCRQVHVPTDHILQDPLRWLDLIEELGVSISWGPNFAFSLINERAEDVRRRKRDLSSMRFLVSAGELVVSNTTRRFLDLLSGCGLSPAALRPAFGMSETCSGITWSGGYRPNANDRDNPFVDLGPPIPSASLRIVDDRDQMSNEGEIGRLQVKGPSVTSGYYRNPEATNKAFTRDGWFDTGDLGFLRDGLLTLTGREKDEIIVNGVNYVAAEIEAVVDGVDGVEVSCSAACAVRSRGSDTEELAIFFCPSAPAKQSLAALLRSIRERVAAEVGVSPTHIVPLDKDQIPKTAIGKIQRPQLKKRFGEGEFEEILKRTEVLAGTNSIPDWFYRKTWHRREPAPQRDMAAIGPCLVFVDRHGLGEAVCGRLARAGRTCVVVEAGEGFVQLGAHRYRVDPRNPADYRRLLAAIGDSAGAIEQILHFWTYAALPEAIGSVEQLRQAQFPGVFSLVFLAQALAEIKGDDARAMELHVFGSHTQITSAADRGTGTHATIIGLLKTIPLETPWLKCRHTDLQADDADDNAACVLRELCIVKSEDEVAYRGGRRLVWGLSRVDLRDCSPVEMPLKEGGIYLVTGGLGGIGAALARILIGEYRAKLILVGTTPLPDRSQWPVFAGRQGKVAERIETLRALEAAGGDVTYHAVDAADLSSLQEVVAAAEAGWHGRLAGVFHLASAGDPTAHWKEMDRHRVSVQSIEVYDAMFRSKVYGTWAIHQLLKDRPDALCVAFSSAISLFGGAAFSAYAAAQSFQNAYAQHARANGFPGSCCFVWSVWEEIGRSKGEPDFVRPLYAKAGFFMIPQQQGIDSLMAALARGQTDLVIGLDCSKPNIHRLLDDAQPLQQLALYHTGDQATASALAVHDRFGAESRCELIRLEAMPLTDGGEIDRNALRSMNQGSAPGSDADRAQPRTEVEERVAAIWREVLGASRPGIHDSFFQLGGNSLAATRVLSRLHEAFDVRLSMQDLFAHASIAGLAALVEERRERTDPAVDDTLEAMDPEALLADVAHMSDAEVAELLKRMQAAEGPQ